MFEAAAAAHLWALSLMRCLTAAGSALISASRTALASTWPRVKVLVEREEDKATKGAGAGREARDERRGGDEREGREERGLTREFERWAGGGREGKAGVEVRLGGRGELERGVER